ncbi:hypothetical protein NSK_005109 [Nannochloropsis salina CCMP1776]|uniref:Uncharacterized protein n=1 Tax=Nannochloropsis salina CCMP1776 TaxID=1027361 RepID=A0A4D9CZK2_9STRA|nr:hypothetical protein NSK_005109 [Nannochloropsis salina CCMP1776]|eukprot:TFJ84014.1 hypothetical protein NSK_005109 [Nannochloropsis salina CCMP1776]
MRPGREGGREGGGARRAGGWGCGGGGGRRGGETGEECDWAGNGLTGEEGGTQNGGGGGGGGLEVGGGRGGGGGGRGRKEGVSASSLHATPGRKDSGGGREEGMEGGAKRRRVGQGVADLGDPRLKFQKYVDVVLPWQGRPLRRAGGEAGNDTLVKGLQAYVSTVVEAGWVRGGEGGRKGGREGGREGGQEGPEVFVKENGEGEGGLCEGMEVVVFLRSEGRQPGGPMRLPFTASGGGREGGGEGGNDEEAGEERAARGERGGKRERGFGFMILGWSQGRRPY